MRKSWPRRTPIGFCISRFEEAAYEAVFEEPIGELLLLKKRLRVIVFDSDTEEIRRWIS